MNSLTQYIDLYREHGQALREHSPQALNAPRGRALEALQGAELPKRGDEGHPALSVSGMFAPDYGVNINRVAFQADAAETFRCGVPNVSTLLAMVVNDTFCPTPSLERNLPEGVEVMSLARAARELPDLVGGLYAKHMGTATAALNTLLVEDGVFVRVRRGVKLDKPLQIVNIFNASMPLMGVRRLLAVIEEGASASILVCDHTANPDVAYLSCQVSEIYLGEHAKLDYYELEESSAATSRHAELYAEQQAGSELTVNGTTLMGGTTCNSYSVEHAGSRASTRLAGMAIASGAQVVDNSTRVEHRHPDCQSDQMFKYILDDKAVGSFYGTIVVEEQAARAKAYQSNRNILASAEARMHTRPQLEIYCDEVKCSHGATIGQLDQNALFYMRQRGIPEAQAKTMLMQAFMADVVDTVSIPSLRSRLAQLIEHRLSGSPDLCSACLSPCEDEKETKQ